MDDIITTAFQASEVVRRRHSCRTFRPEPISGEDHVALEEYISHGIPVPFNTGPRFALMTAKEGDETALKQLGTYGIIKNARGFIAGAMKDRDKSLEDFGFAMESIILFATSRGIGTCWLGGTFTKSAFAERISLSDEESIPAVVAIGYPAEKRRVAESLIRMGSRADHRKHWDSLFFSGDFSDPMTQEKAGPWREALELLRLGPSASNRQPWRVVMRDGSFHLYLQRTKGYYQRYKTLIGMSDLQRVDMGIAMCHFEMAVKNANLEGAWSVDDPGLADLPELTEYVVSWKR